MAPVVAAGAVVAWLEAVWTQLQRGGHIGAGGIRKFSVDDIVRFLTHFSVSRAIKDSVMEAEPLGRPQRPRPAKKVENAATMLYKWLLKEANPVLWRQAKLSLRGRNGFSQGLQ